MRVNWNGSEVLFVRDTKGVTREYKLESEIARLKPDAYFSATSGEPDNERQKRALMDFKQAKRHQFHILDCRFKPIKEYEKPFGYSDHFIIEYYREVENDQ